MKTRVAIWAAVSSKPQAAEDKTSLGDQEDLGRRYANRIGGEVVRVYKVPGHSRDLWYWPDAERAMPAYRQLREDAEADVFDDLWVLDPDRLGRDAALSHQVKSLIKKSGRRLWVESGQYYVSEKAGAGGYLFSFQAESGDEAQKERVARHDSGMRGRVKRGLPAARWPHGYQGIRDRDGKTTAGEFVPGEIEAVELATELFLDGKGYYTMAKELDSSPWRPQEAECWSLSTVRSIVMNDVYAGYVSYGDTRNAEPSDKFPALWDAETHRAILRERDRRRRHPGGSPPASLASGCVICNRCGWSMSVTRRGSRVYFRCRRHSNWPSRPCHCNLIREHVIIEYLEIAIAAELQQPVNLEATLERVGPGRASIEQEIEDWQAKAAEIQERQYRLAVLAEDGAIDTAAARRRTAELAEQLAAVDRSLKRAQERLIALPDRDELRRRLEHLAKYTDLRSRPLGEARAALLRAGTRVYVEEREIVRIVFGVLS